MYHPIYIADETILAVGEHILVASHSQPGSWHEVTFSSCTCEGHAHGHVCRHIRAVRAYLARAIREQARRDAVDVDESDLAAELAAMSDEGLALAAGYARRYQLSTYDGIEAERDRRAAVAR